MVFNVSQDYWKHLGMRKFVVSEGLWGSPGDWLLEGEHTRIYPHIFPLLMIHLGKL